MKAGVRFVRCICIIDALADEWTDPQVYSSSLSKKNKEDSDAKIRRKYLHHIKIFVILYILKYNKINMNKIKKTCLAYSVLKTIQTNYIFLKFILKLL